MAEVSGDLCSRIRRGERRSSNGAPFGGADTLQRQKRSVSESAERLGRRVRAPWLERYYSTVQLEPERRRAARSPTPRRSWASVIWRAISLPYSGRWTARKTPMGVGS